MSPVRRTISASWAPVLVYVILALGILIGDRTISAPKYDQDMYHYQVVREFSAEWPAFDVTDYGSATSPLYHVVMATAAKVVGDELDTLRLLSAVFGLAFIVVVAGWAATVVTPRTAAFLTMPLAASIYVLGSGVHVHTDNMGWLLVVLALGPLVFLPVRPGRLCLSGLFILLAVAVRQVMVWVLGPLLLAGMLASPLLRLLPEGLRREREPAPVSWSPFVVSLLVAIPSVLLVLVFVWLWGGLVPPRFQELHASSNSPCAAGYAFAVFAIYAPFFLIMIPRPMEVLDGCRGWVCLLAAVGALLVLAFPSAYSIPDGRYGGPVWLLASKGPVIADRSLMLAAMAAFGAASFVLLVAAAVRNGKGLPALLLVCSWCATHSTQLVNAQTFQRYFDTPSLVILTWLGALLLSGRSDSDSRVAVGPPLLAVFLALLLVYDVLNT